MSTSENGLPGHGWRSFRAASLQGSDAARSQNLWIDGSRSTRYSHRSSQSSPATFDEALRFRIFIRLPFFRFLSVSGGVHRAPSGMLWHDARCAWPHPSVGSSLARDVSNFPSTRRISSNTPGGGGRGFRNGSVRRTAGSRISIRA